MTLKEIKLKTVNPYAGWWTIVGIDPIAFRLVWILQRVWPQVNPNVVTTMSLLVGVAAAFLLSQGLYLWGGLLYEVSFLLDCIDGKMSRLQGRSNTFGKFYDGFVNTFVYGAALIGMGVSMKDNQWMLGGVAAALLLHVLALEMAAHQMVHGGASSHRVRSQRITVLGRLRENYPMMWPDRHLGVFLIMPVLGLPIVGVLANVVIDAALQVIRFVRIRRSCD